MKTTRNAFLIALTLATAAPASETGSAGDGDLARLQGCWAARVGPRHDIQVALRIEGRRVEVRITLPQGAPYRARGELKLDEAASPRALDWIGFTGQDGQSLPEILAIYRFDGERWTVCNGGANGERPAAFEPGDGLLADVVVFERAGSDATATSASPAPSPSRPTRPLPQALASLMSGRVPPTVARLGSAAAAFLLGRNLD